MAYQKRPTSSYQPCDTFFVESYDSAPAPRIDPKEHAKFIARERQYAIADELSRITSDDFRDDIVSHMLDMDVGYPFGSPWVGKIEANCACLGGDPPRCRVDRYPDRDSVVHASLPP